MIGTSQRMLHYHFRSREDLLVFDTLVDGDRTASDAAFEEFIELVRMRLGNGPVDDS